MCEPFLSWLLHNKNRINRKDGERLHSRQAFLLAFKVIGAFPNKSYVTGTFKSWSCEITVERTALLISDAFSSSEFGHFEFVFQCYDSFVAWTNLESSRNARSAFDNAAVFLSNRQVSKHLAISASSRRLRSEGEITKNTKTLQLNSPKFLTLLQSRELNIFVDLAKQKKFIKKLSAFTLGILMLLVLVPLGAFVNNLELSLIQLNSHTYQLLFNFFYTSQFAGAAFAVRERFKILNEYLKSATSNDNLIDLKNIFFIEFPSISKMEKLKLSLLSRSLWIRLFSWTFTTSCVMQLT